MKVKILASFTNVVDGNVYRLEEGQEIELPDNARWIEMGKAVPVKRQTRKAVKKKGSKAVKDE